ncbi:hypothetical protein [Paenibacillus tengchongensis]|uniref:hypothetical protein n=1 Tax=Paenibacillus tengchongensis TaxID=2608684 RepID=UPI00124BCF5C|nr:hypothetical protein [Paenibacillus tengchongensis]
MKLFNRRTVRVPYAKIKKANRLRNESTKDDWVHWADYREQIREVIAKTMEDYQPGCGHIVLLGAGNGNDVPISYIETVFERITIVDIDEQALDRLIAKSAYPGKFCKAVIDLTGLGQTVTSLADLKNNIEALEPAVDLTKVAAPVDVAMNLCFTTQLLSAYFHREKDKEISAEFSAALDRLLERIHIGLFEGLAGLLAESGVVIHLTDTLLLQTKQDYVSPATPKVEAIVKGDRKGNAHLLYGHLKEWDRQGLCLPGAFIPRHPDILRRFTAGPHYSLLWQFVHDEYEDRDYYVTAHVLAKK